MGRRSYIRSAATRPLPTYTCALCTGPAVKADICHGCGARVCAKHRICAGPHQLLDHERARPRERKRKV